MSGNEDNDTGDKGTPIEENEAENNENDEVDQLEKARLEEKKRKEKKFKQNQRKKRQILLQNKENGKNMEGRLIITHLELENFKSYAGVKTIGPFHKCFSAVVGPNGSGKSNVVDAMLFVFGKRAKKLRLKKVSQLIHKSSEHPKCTYARVTVYFKNIVDDDSVENGFKSVANSEITVTRYAYDTNKSDYYVDDRKVTFKEVYNLLIQRGIDLHQNRFLILQGEVEQISLMKPKRQKDSDDDGLLEYLEDIIGTNKYIDAIEDKEEELEVIEEERNNQFNILTVSEKEIESLEKGKNDALYSLEKEREIIFHRNALVNLNLKQDTQLLTDTETKLKELKEKKEKIFRVNNTNGTNLKDSLQSVMSEISILNKTLGELNVKLDKHKNDFVVYERKQLQLNENISHSKKKSGQIEKKVKKENSAMEKLSIAISEDKESVVSKQEKIEALKVTVTENEECLEQLLEKVGKETKPLRNSLEKKQKELSPLLLDRTKVENDIAYVKTEISILEKNVNDALNNITNLEEQVEVIQQKSVKYPKLIEEKIQNKDDLALKLDELRIKVKKKFEVEAVLEKKIKSCREKLSRSRVVVDDIPKRKKIVYELLRIQEKENKKFSLVGRVGDVASIDKKFDVAVSTSCGTLDYLITETSKGAETAIMHLKHHKLGRANFASLDKIDDTLRRMRSPFKLPKCKASKKIYRLFDLIDFTKTKELIENKYKNKDEKEKKEIFDRIRAVFYLGLKNTIVAPDLQVGSEIAYKMKQRYRVVTLTGQLIEMSGSISGGGKRSAKGFMGITGEKHKTDVFEDTANIVDKKTIKELEDKLSRSLDKLQHARTIRQELENEISQVTLTVSSLNSEIEVLKLDLKGFKEESDQLQTTINLLKAKTTLTAEEKEKKANFDSEIKKLEASLKENHKTSKDLEDSCKELEKQLEDCGGAELTSLKSGLEETKNLLTQTIDEELKLSFAIKSNEQAIAKIDKKLKKLNKDLEIEVEKCTTLTTEQEKIESKASELSATLKELENERHSQKKLISEKQDEAKEISNKINELESEVIKLETKIEEVETSRTKIVNRKNGLENRLKQNEKEFTLLIPKCLQDQAKKSFDNGNEDISDGDDSIVDNDLGLDKQYNKFLSLDVRNTEDDSDKEEIEEKLEKATASLKKLKSKLGKNLSLKHIDDYYNAEEIYKSKLETLSGITQRRNLILKELDKLKKQRLNEFMAGFQEISLSLKTLYQMLTLGGDADLDLVDSLDPFSEGITFSVRPPKKSWKDIRNLSGGEKTLSSLSLVFALHKYERNALYVMDEIDAALDFRNVSIVANYIKQQTKDAQFIVISLRNNMFELADRLIGIYKTHNATKSITIDPQQIVDKINNENKKSPDRQSNILKEVNDSNQLIET